MALDIKQFRPGTRLILTRRNMRGESKSAAIVTLVNFNGLGGITYTNDFSDPELSPSGSGWFDPKEVGTKPYGLVVAVEIRN